MSPWTNHEVEPMNPLLQGLMGHKSYLDLSCPNMIFLLGPSTIVAQCLVILNANLSLEWSIYTNFPCIASYSRLCYIRLLAWINHFYFSWKNKKKNNIAHKIYVVWPLDMSIPLVLLGLSSTTWKKKYKTLLPWIPYDIQVSNIHLNP